MAEAGVQPDYQPVPMPDADPQACRVSAASNGEQVRISEYRRAVRRENFMQVYLWQAHQVGYAGSRQVAVKSLSV